MTFVFNALFVLLCCSRDILLIFSFAVEKLPFFSDEENSVLLATDVAARGLDIRDVEHVIHYQLPKTAEVGFCVKTLSELNG